MNLTKTTSYTSKTKVFNENLLKKYKASKILALHYNK